MALVRDSHSFGAQCCISFMGLIHRSGWKNDRLQELLRQEATISAPIAKAIDVTYCRIVGSTRQHKNKAFSQGSRQRSVCVSRQLRLMYQMYSIFWTTRSAAFVYSKAAFLVSCGSFEQSMRLRIATVCGTLSSEILESLYSRTVDINRTQSR